MPFSQRNIFYLRTSAHVVLQTILYLDPRDLKWMNSYAHYDDQVDDDENDEFEAYERDERTGDLVWSRALSRLKHKIMPKLRDESIEGEYLSSTNKKEKVDTHIEPDFQMAYFFRKVSGKHAVLLKQKELKFPGAGAGAGAEGAANLSSSNAMPPPNLPASAMKRSSAKDAMPESRLASRQSNQTDNTVSQGARIATSESVQDDEEDIKPETRKRTREDEDDDLEAFTMSSFTQPIRVKEEDEEIQVLQSESTTEVTNIESIDVDARQDDKKPRLHVNYSGFKIFGKCFIVVIEPTKRTKRLRPSLFQTTIPKELHQLSATPVPMQSRETPVPSIPRRAAASPSSSRRSLSLARDRGNDDDNDDDEEEEEERQDSRRSRNNTALFRGMSNDWTPTPTPEPERRLELARAAAATVTETDDDGEEPNSDESTSMMLATQMLEGGIAGQGNDIDDD